MENDIVGALAAIEAGTRRRTAPGNRMLKRLIVISFGFYLLVGASLGIRTYEHDLRSFRCEDPGAPHGYVTMTTTEYRNPDPARCTRRGAEPGSLLAIPFLTAFGAPILLLRGFDH